MQKHASPFCLTTLQKVEFALLFQKPIQDPSTKPRQTIQEFCFAEFFSFCTRLLVKQEFPAAKALVGMTGFGPQSSVHKQSSVYKQSSVHKYGIHSRNPVQAGFRCFVPLQRKTQFL